jgi:alkylation response protein AidB-like acyl-CoA dehydrogenase
MMEALGPYAEPFSPHAIETGERVTPFAPDHAGPIAARYFAWRKTSIYGGSNEIQRNIIAQMVLGL